jgi:site-specific DNA recombinase
LLHITLSKERLQTATRPERVLSKKGTLIDKGYLYRLLNNRVYRGEAVHKGTAYPGEHDAIIDARLWDQVHDILGESPRMRANNSRTRTPALLKGLLFTATGAAMTPSSTMKGTRRYRYYVSMDLLKNREMPDDGIPRRLPADTVEGAVIGEIRRVLRTPETTAQVIAKLDRNKIPDADAIAALQKFPQLWVQLFPGEQARIIQLLVRRVTVTVEGLVIDLRTDAIAGVMREMMTPRPLVVAE